MSIPLPARIRGRLRGSLSCRHWPPLSAIASQQFVCFPWTPCASRIVREVARLQRLPYIEHRRNDTPPGFDHVRPLEQGRISNHAVVEQALVTIAGRRPEVVRVVETHVDGALLHDRPRYLRAKPQRDALLRLNGDDQAVAAQGVHGGVAEQMEGGALELNGNLGDSSGEMLARPQIKRDVGPPPVVNEKLHGNKCFRARTRVYVSFITIGWYLFAIHGAGGVLAAHSLG